VPGGKEGVFFAQVMSFIFNELNELYGRVSHQNLMRGPMTSTQKARSYTATAKILHWLIVVLLVVQFVVAWTMPHIGRNT
jgi:hypothetical protein